VCIEIPEGTEPGDHTVIGEDEEGGTGEDTTNVYTPTLEVTSPVAAGDETEVTSGGWLPESAVELQLVDPAGEPVGDPVPATTDADGNVPAGTTVPVPMEAEPGDGYTVVGTDENGAEVSAPLEVTPAEYEPTIEATSPVLAGGDTTVTSGGWLPESDVTLQLT
ncbi:hypothetical protein, partial [Microbacterium karelineae]|uniref:hypothetical protein n=1 Tax=Microbacterium karelineae TaxID=2654283 RepID=UPI0018D3A63B